MEARVIKLYDASHVVPPAELTRWKVEDGQIDARLELLSHLCAGETEVDVAAKGDCVICTARSGAPDDRKILLYPGHSLPGAAQAERACVGLKAGALFSSGINGVEMELTVDRILRRIPAAIDDALVREQGIEGVSTVEEYRLWFSKTAGEKNRERALKQVKNFLLDTIAANSVFELDEEEFEREAERQAEEAYARQSAVAGSDLGDRESYLRSVKEACILGAKRSLAEQALCEAHGFTYKPEMFMDELKAMAQSMPDMEPMLADYADMYTRNAYADKAQELLDEQAQTCMEV